MPILKIGILLGGVVSLLVANGHRTFYKYFHWEAVFKDLSVLNSKVFYTIHIFLIPLFLFSAYVSFFYADALSRAEPGLPRDILIFNSLFWLSRGIWQLTYLRPSRLGVDQKKGIRMHLIILGTSLLCFTIYFAPLIMT
jgi:hypothetical protein